MSLINRLNICSSSGGYTTHCWIELDILVWSIVLDILAWSIPLWRLYWSHEEEHCLKSTFKDCFSQNLKHKGAIQTICFLILLESRELSSTFVKVLVILIECVCKIYFWFPFGIFIFSIILHLILTVPNAKKHILWQKWVL